MTERDQAACMLREGVIRLLEIKDSDIRIMILKQGLDAVDRGVHIGGAFSCVIPMISLYFGGILSYDLAQPTRLGQDMFVLSKGHAVATLASIYADLGYFDRSVLVNSRSLESILNGHPGPILPGIHISTGPEGHGMPVAQGFAIAGKQSPRFDVFTVTGDGELQAGLIWEAAMFSGAKRLDNLCLIVDKNEGQLDNHRSLVFPMTNLPGMFESFGWRVFDVDGRQYGPVVQALETFKFGKRDGRPTAIICNTRKGFGGFSSFMAHHKVELPESLALHELEQQRKRRKARVERFFELLDTLPHRETDRIREQLLQRASKMNLSIEAERREAQALQVPARVKKAPPREKRVPYDAQALPKIEAAKGAAASEVITQAMKVFAASGMVASVDADLGTTSGLEGGVGYADQEKALNVGVAESNMSCIGEAFAVLGYNTWVSTFCPFFDWRVLRRIGIGYQERQESIALGGWLSDGHNLDLTFLATAANFDTRTNGATHMGNDDLLVFGEIAHLKIIDTCCPNQLLGVMKWIMEGNRGLVYLRIMRAASAVIHGGDFRFEYGKGYWVKGSIDSSVFLLSSGRQVHESLAAARILEQAGLDAAVLDLPSIDEELLAGIAGTGKPIVLAEQNNGFILSGLRKTVFRKPGRLDASRLLAINTLDPEGRPGYIHSATYEQLLERFGLSPGLLAERIKKILAS